TLQRVLAGYITGKPDYSYTSPVDGVLDCGLHHAGCLCRCLDYLVIAAAIIEKFYSICFLMGVGAKFTGMYCGGNCNHRNSGTVCIVKAIDKMHMSRSRTAGTTTYSVKFSFSSCC